MIDPKYIVTFSQYNEDIILSTLLHDIVEGFYVDVGASYPTIDSVTKMFYEKGWRGINIEPIQSIYKLVKEERPRDINICCGVGEEPGLYDFREYKESPGHSTFEHNQKNDASNKTLSHQDYKVEIKQLKEILIENKVKHIHFLKIDVEGYEYQVINSNNWAKFRPEVICIESNHISKDWRPLLRKNNYRLFISDGLNEYYVAKESWSRTDNFAELVVEADYHALKQHQWQSWLQDSRDLERLIKEQAELQKHIVDIDQRLHEYQQLSLKNRSLLGRLRTSLYGLTIDWYRFKKR